MPKDIDALAAACLHDPLTAAVLSMDEIQDMVSMMLKKNREHLPQFKHFDVGR